MRQSVSLLVIVFALQFGLARSSAAQSTTEVVIEWNRIMQATAAVPGALTPTIFVSRPYAILHIAIFDALNSIDYTYKEYAVRATAASTASREVAAAQAAHDVMVAMAPSLTSTFDAALAVTMARFPGDPGTQGAAVGAVAAKAILAARANDGWNRPAQPYILPDLPGYWQPVPPANAAATFVIYQDALPFALGSRMQFMVEAPPALTSARYAADLNEVKAIGGTNSTVRTAQQTQTAQMWQSVGFSTGPFGAWNNVARDVSLARGLNGLDTARVFAMLAVALHDGLQTTMTGKYIYGLWRPTTAIREAGRDNNPATEADPTFVSSVPTPPYPSYPGNMACIGVSAATVLSRLFGRDDIPFSIIWAGVNQANVTRSYNGFRHAAGEQERARVYGGLHFTFDNLASAGACTNVANYAYDNYMTPRTP